MDNEPQMATSAMFKTLRELYEEPSNDEVLARLKIAAASFLPEGWEDWRVREEVSVDSDPSLLNKLRFCLPAVDIAKAFDPEASNLSERPYRDMKVKMLSWAFCRGLILGPPSLAMQIRGSGLHYELVNQATKHLKDSLLTRKEAAKVLGAQSSDAETEESFNSSRKRKSSTSRLDALEQDARQTKELLQAILNRLGNNQPISSDEEEEGEGESDGSEEIPWSPPSLEKEQVQPKIDFLPQTKEQEPTIPEPKPDIKTQGLECQRLGKETWNKIRYAEVQKKLNAAPVFSALLVNPPLRNLAPTGPLTDHLERTEGAYGTISHGLLLQRAAFSKAINKIIEQWPSALSAVTSELTSSECEFRQLSDNLLQFVCGKRAEAIEQRRKALSVNNNIASVLHKIPPSEDHLFDERKLEEICKLPATSFDAFKVKKIYKKNNTKENYSVSTAKKPKYQKKKKEVNRPSTSSQDRSQDNRNAKKKFQAKSRHPQARRHS